MLMMEWGFLKNSQNKMFSNEDSDIAISLRNFIAQPMIFFSNFCDQNWIITEETDIDLEKKFIHC